MDLFYRVIADVVAPSANPPKPLYADLLTRLTYAQVPSGKLKLSNHFQAAVKCLIHRDARLGFWGCFSGTDFLTWKAIWDRKVSLSFSNSAWLV